MSVLRVNGVSLNVEVLGEGPPLVLLHGFTGSAATWSSLAARLERQFTVITPDLLGHGLSDSPEDPDRYRVERCVEDVLAVADRLGFGRINLLGYSMGGRVALRLVVDAPQRVRTLILESASPGITPAAAREARREADDALAARINREGIEAFVDYWENIPLFASQRQLPDEVRAGVRQQRLRSDPIGLANSLRGLGAGVGEPLFDRLASIDVPTLLVAGELDLKYCELAELMARSIPSASLALIPGAGHTVHLEQTEAFDQVVREFLDREAR